MGNHDRDGNTFRGPEFDGLDDENENMSGECISSPSLLVVDAPERLYITEMQ